MSNAHSHSDTPPEVEDAHLHDMKLGTIVVIGAISLAIFALGILWAYELMVRREHSIRVGGEARVPSEIGKDEIGIVDQVPFDIDHRLEVWRSAHAKRLSGYGWVDRAKGVAHMPIEKAMERVIADPPDVPGQGVPPVAHPPAVAPTGARSTATKPGGKP